MILTTKANAHKGNIQRLTLDTWLLDNRKLERSSKGITITNVTIKAAIKINAVIPFFLEFGYFCLAFAKASANALPMAALLCWGAFLGLSLDGPRFWPLDAWPPPFDLVAAP